MDFNDNGANAYNDETNEVVVAVATEQADLDTLQTLKKRIQTCKKSMTDAFLKIETEIEEVRKTIPASKVKVFLVSECGLNRSDINTYLKFADTLGHHRELVQKKSLPFTLVKSLVAASEKVRDEAIERIELGSFVHSSDVSAIKRHFAAQSKDPAVGRSIAGRWTRARPISSKMRCVATTSPRAPASRMPVSWRSSTRAFRPPPFWTRTLPGPRNCWTQRGTRQRHGNARRREHRR